MKKQTAIAEKEDQISDKLFSLIFWSIKYTNNAIKSIIKKEDIAKPLAKKKYIKQNLIYNTISFFGYCDVKQSIHIYYHFVLTWKNSI